MPRCIVIRRYESGPSEHKYKKSSRPFIHETREGALVEAIRLAEMHKGTFCILEEVGVITPPLKAEKAVKQVEKVSDEPVAFDGVPLKDVLKDGIAKVLKKAKVKSASTQK